ncbi:MAG: hypothetical protein JST50_17370 [Bacteroidetes bacterium]|nr:hypothetical protein [Bacteroidota bacterium]
MKRCYGYMVFIAVLLLSNIQAAMAQSRNSLRITEDNHLILQIDIQSSKNTLDSILTIAGVSATSDQVQKANFTALDKDGWTIVDHDGSLYHFDRSLEKLNENPPKDPYTISLQIPQINGKPGYPAEVKFGVNRFARVTVYQLPSGLTRFMLPGNTRAKRVMLSGNFNSWSTLKGSMTKTDGGWIIDVKLSPGVYQYKYIIQGRWTTDPNNLQDADDGNGNVNSVYYKYNYTFRLKGYASARKVTVAGDFNNWNAEELVMERHGNTWEKQLYLGDGKHTYRFMVDGEWVADPANSVKEKDDNGRINCVLMLGEVVHFKLNGYTNAEKVSVAGSFNDWAPNKIFLKKTPDGWALPMILNPGNYGYKFIVDGRWITDPQNQNYMVEKGVTNSFVAAKPNYTFRLKGYKNAKSVKLSGTFIDWDKNGYTMAHNGDEWTISVNLKPGKYLYKFIVDGKWIRDPGNKYWEDNDSDNGNSVLWIE